MTDPQRIVTTIINTHAMSGGRARAHPELISFEGRRTIYSAWTKLVRSNAGTQRHKALNWFVSTYPRYPLQDLESFKARVLLLVQLDSLHEQLGKEDQTLPLVLKCMQTQIPIDYMRVCAVDMLYLNLGSSQTDGSEKAIQLMAQTLLKSLHGLPWKSPSPRSLQFLEGLFASTMTRTCTFADMTKHLQTFQILAEHGKDSGEKLKFWLSLLNRMVSKYEPSPLLVPTMLSRLGVLRTRLFHPEKLGRDRVVGPELVQLTALEDLLSQVMAKLEASAISQNANAVPPFQLDFATALPPGSTIRKPATHHVQVASGGKTATQVSTPHAMEAKKQSMSLKDNRNHSGSAIDLLEPKPALEVVRDFNEATPEVLLPEQDATQQNTVERPSSAHYHRESVRQLSGNDVFAKIPDIWMQLDPILDRIVTGSTQGPGDEPPPPEVLVSTRPGSLSMTRASIVWAPVANADTAAAARTNTKKLKKKKSPSPPNTDLNNGSSNRPGHRKHRSSTSARLTGVEGDDTVVQVDDDSDSLSESSSSSSSVKDEEGLGQVAILWKDVVRWNFTPIGGSEASFLVIHTSQAYKFFPFYDNETFEMTAALVDLTGHEPFDEKAYVQKIIQDRLAARRQDALRTLQDVYGDETWIIDNTRELLKLLATLCRATGKQNLFDVERLFHSCRLNQEVTKESLQELRRIFNETLDRKVKSKVLAICDRLVDRAVVHVGDYNFNYVNAWLKKVETHLDPYREAESLAQVIELRSRLEEFKKQAIRGIPETQVKEVFDSLGELRAYRQQRT